jgi:glucose uptake protein GlcU
MSYSDTQKIYIIVGVLALALIIGGIVMYMKKEESEED